MFNVNQARTLSLGTESSAGGVAGRYGGLQGWVHDWERLPGMAAFLPGWVHDWEKSVGSFLARLLEVRVPGRGACRHTSHARQVWVHGYQRWVSE